MGGFVPISGPPGGLLCNPNGKLMHKFLMPIANSLPSFPGMDRSFRTHATWPVWSGSTTKEIKFQRMPKKVATRLYHRARDFDRKTNKAGCHGGAVGPAALKVLEALLFDFLNYTSGQLDPSYAAIARKANVCVRTVTNALRRLKQLGIVNWMRRCAETWQDGRFVLEQETNAYAVLPPSQWRGYKEQPEPPPPAPGTWGDHPPLPSVLVQAAADRRDGASPRAIVRTLGSDEGDPLAAALARLGWALESRNPQ
jgi:hypothetical protein